MRSVSSSPLFSFLCARSWNAARFESKFTRRGIHRDVELSVSLDLEWRSFNLNNKFDNVCLEWEIGFKFFVQVSLDYV